MRTVLPTRPLSAALLLAAAMAGVAIGQRFAPAAAPPAADAGGSDWGPPPAVAPGGDAPPGLQWRILENPNGPHTTLVLDPIRQVFAVYQVDLAAGQIRLTSVRNLASDLRLEQFNSNNPAPKDVRAMLDEAR